MKLMAGHPRVRAAFLLAVSSFFVGAGAYHTHDLARPARDGASLEARSLATRAVDDACAVCKLAQSTAQVATPVGSVHPDDSLAVPLSVSTSHPAPGCELFPSSPRAPPLA
jgi:hypothetical protein